MMGGKAAAEALLACRQTGDYSAASTRLYHTRWMELFGHDFKLVSCPPARAWQLRRARVSTACRCLVRRAAGLRALLPATAPTRRPLAVPTHHHHHHLSHALHLFNPHARPPTRPPTLAVAARR